MRRAPLLPVVAALVFAAAAAAGIAAGGLAGFASPLASRILYVHVPSAWAAYAAFAVVVGAGAAVLRGGPRAEAWDALALACAEVGALFAGLALVTGIVWARAEFGGDYSLVRDPKLLTTLVLVLAYVGYLMLRRGVDVPERRARLAAVYGVAAFVGVPLSWLANRAATPHPDLTRGTELAPALWGLLLLALAAFTLVGAALAHVRYALARVEAAVERGRGDLLGG